jgi:hypothetical protein
MKAVFKLLLFGAIAAIAFEIHRRRQRWDRELRGGRSERRNLDPAAGTHAVVGGDPTREHRGPRPQVTSGGAIE